MFLIVISPEVPNHLYYYVNSTYSNADTVYPVGVYSTYVLSRLRHTLLHTVRVLFILYIYYDYSSTNTLYLGTLYRMTRVYQYVVHQSTPL
jgi:hypothetical protein